MTAQRKPPAPLVPISHSVDSAAQAIGVSPSTVWKLIADHELPTFKLGHRTLIHRDDLEAFIQARRQAVA